MSSFFKVQVLRELKFSYNFPPNVTQFSQVMEVGTVPIEKKWTVKSLVLVYNDIYNGAMNYALKSEFNSTNAGWQLRASIDASSFGGVGPGLQKKIVLPVTNNELFPGDRLILDLAFNAGDIGIGAEYFEAYVVIEEVGPK